MKKVFLFLSLCLFVVSFANDAAAQQKNHVSALPVYKSRTVYLCQTGNRWSGDRLPCRII